MVSKVSFSVFASMKYQMWPFCLIEWRWHTFNPEMFSSGKINSEYSWRGRWGYKNMDNNCSNAVFNLTCFPKHAIFLTYHTSDGCNYQSISEVWMKVFHQLCCTIDLKCCGHQSFIFCDCKHEVSDVTIFSIEWRWHPVDLVTVIKKWNKAVSM